MNTFRPNAGCYRNLLSQAEKLYRHNRQGSYKTKERYYEVYKRFLRYLTVTCKLEKLANISGKQFVRLCRVFARSGVFSLYDQN